MKGTKDRAVSSGYTSWLDFCEAKMPCKCANLACSNWAEVGAHVKKVGVSDGAWYIVPFCTKCNASDDDKIVLESALKKLR